MRRTEALRLRRGSARVAVVGRCARTLLPVLALLPAAGARAQGNACDQLKGVLAARIEATGVRGYSLEAVPGSAPVPPGAKVVGNCEGGASKILYRRWGAARSAATASSEAEVTATAPAAAAAQEAPRRPAVAATERAPRAAPASSPEPAPSAVVRPAVAVVMPPVPVPAPAPKAEPAKPAAAGAGKVPSDWAPAVAAEAPASAPAPAPATDPAPAPAAPGPASPVVVPLAERASEFLTGRWLWLWAVLLVPAAAWLWAGYVRRRDYDAAGLPRGPRL